MTNAKLEEFKRQHPAGLITLLELLDQYQALRYNPKETEGTKDTDSGKRRGAV